MNEQGKTCPACQKDVGYWAIIKAPMPNMIRCGHCGSGLRYEKGGWTIFFLAALGYLFLIAGLVTYGYIYQRGLQVRALITSWIIISFMYWLPLEIFVSGYLRGHQKLIINKRSGKA